MKIANIFVISAVVLGLILISLVQPGKSAKILSVVFFSSKSHKITYDLLLRELANRGHEVTVLSPVPSKSNRTNPREILTLDIDAFMATGPDMYDLKMKGETMNPFTMIDTFSDLCRKSYALPQVQELLKEKFDLVLHEPFMNECMAGYLYKLNTSLILLSPFTVSSDLIRLLGGPAPPSFVPNLFSSFESKMNFYERLLNFITEIIFTGTQRYYFIPKMEALYREQLNDSTIPGHQEILQNASFILSNSHFSLGGARAFMPDIVEVGGMHLRQPKALPKVNNVT